MVVREFLSFFPFYCKNFPTVFYIQGQNKNFTNYCYNQPTVYLFTRYKNKWSQGHWFNQRNKLLHPYGPYLNEIYLLITIPPSKFNRNKELTNWNIRTSPFFYQKKEKKRNQIKIQQSLHTESTSKSTKQFLYLSQIPAGFFSTFKSHTSISNQSSIKWNWTLQKKSSPAELIINL